MSKSSLTTEQGAYNKTPYRSMISPRSASMSRSKVMSGTTAALVNPFPPMQTISSVLPFSALPISKAVSGASIREFREKEKRELSELNDRFASYVERVRFLEAQNKQLRLETDALKSRLGVNGSKIKEMYETELKQARDVIDQTTKEKMLLETRVQKAEDDAELLKTRYDDLLTTHNSELEKLSAMAKEMSENEASISLMTRRLSDMEEELQRYKGESQKLLLEVQRITSDLYQETTARLQLQNEKQSLEEELSFLKQIHAQEIEDLQQLAFKDTYLDPSNFFRHELTNAIKEIRAEYEALNQQQKAELENWYRIKVTNAMQEMQTKRLFDVDQKPRDDAVKTLHEQITSFRRENTFAKQKNEELENRIEELESIIRRERESGRQAIDDRDHMITDLRSKLDDLLAEYEELLSSNTNLNTEISVYRKLLEGGEEKQGLRHVVEEIEQRARKDWAERHLKQQNAEDRKIQTVTFQTEVTGTAAPEDFEKREVVETARAVKPVSEPVEEAARETSPKVQTAQERVMSRKSSVTAGQAEARPTAPIPLKASESQETGEDDEEEKPLDKTSGKGDYHSDKEETTEQPSRKTIETISGSEVGSSMSAASSSGDQPMSICGQLLVDMSYDVGSRSLAFVVKRGRNVQQFTGTLFIRCTLMPDKLKQKSHAVQAASAPVWNTLFEFDCPSLAACRLKTVYFALKQSRPSYRGDQVITVGRAKLPLLNVDLESGEFDSWVDFYRVTPDQHCSDSSENSDRPY